jgi:hypothetical protein
MYIINEILQCLHILQVRNRTDSTVFSSNDCFINELSIFTCLGVDELSKILILL